MSFTSYSFLLFSGVLIPVYYLIPKRFQWWLLLLASWIFYLAAGLQYAGFLLITICTTYFSVRRMEKNLRQRDRQLAALSREEKREYKARLKARNRRIMLLCVTVNFTVLAVCKACLVRPFQAIADSGPLTFLTLGLPLGISFYMFQSMGYVIDVYREKAKPEENFFKLALFASFFPQLVQGPISKFSDLSPTLFGSHDYDRKEVSFGLQRMLWGYFKKLVIADRIAPAVIALNTGDYTGVAFLVLTVFYAIRICGDFTGGIDIAIGLGQCLGIRMPENFIRPFFSKNIAEYWRRWHITLGEWMKDYIFYPISVCAPMRKLSKAARKRFGQFGKRLPIYAASVATWFVTGIWHGLTPNFILWGMLNCAVIVISEELSPLYARFHNRFHLKEKTWYGGFEMLRMFFLMNLIRACDLFPNVGEYFRRLGSLLTTFNVSVLWDGTLMELGLTGLDYIIVFAGCLLLLAVSILQEKKGSVRELLWQKPAALRWGLMFLLFLAVLLMGSYGIGYDASNFIYNQF